jgi:hypothetical protein
MLTDMDKQIFKYGKWLVHIYIIYYNYDEIIICKK